MENIEEKATETIKLRKPMADGTTEITLDFDKLTGYALIKCEKEAKKEDATISVQILSQIYQARVAAVAASVKYDDICNLSGNDFAKVTSRVRNFLADLDS